MIIMSTLTTAVAIFAAGVPAFHDEGRAVVNDGVIIAHSGRPSLSGFDRTWVIIEVRTADATTREMYMPYMTPDQFVPPVHSICNIEYHSAFLDGLTLEHAVPRNRELEVIDKISCNSGQFVMTW